MKVILLERVGKLGGLGEEVNVKDGFARNFLLPQGKALRANDANRAQFEAQRAELEKQNEARRNDAQSLADKLDGTTLVVIRSAGETGQLYGSVSTRDIASDLAEQGFSVAKNQIELANPIKTIGLHSVVLSLHAEVTQTITLNVARSADEAERQAAGEDLSVVDYYADEEETPATEDMLEEGVDLEGAETEEEADQEAPAEQEAE